MQASSGEQPMDSNDQAAAVQHEFDIDEDHAVPDVELLQFQKQRSTPKVRLSEVNMDNDEEIVHAEVEDFGQVSTSAAHLGMARAGSEEVVIRQLHKAGSIDASALLPDITAAVQESAGAAQQEEEMKV